MNRRTERLHRESLAARPRISIERARLLTRFYRENEGKYPTAVLRARAFHHLCEHKTIHIGPGELIVGERGGAPKEVPTFPELTCHTREDLEILGRRRKTGYSVDAGDIETYEREIAPYWNERSLRHRIFRELPGDWMDAYEAGIFTEFMEQRAPGHTVADGKIYRVGLADLKADIASARQAFRRSGEDGGREDRLAAMEIAADAAILFARRHADLAERMAERSEDQVRRKELENVARICRRVPEHAPTDFHEALQMYWFCHLAVITELNGWDAYSPGHLDQHLEPFYRKGTADGTLTRESARELLECFFIKFNNHPAPPKVGVTAAESGTYTDFANINLGGVDRHGEDGTGEISYLLLDVIDDMHMVQPSNNVQISRKTPDRFLRSACRVIRNGYGFPSVFNSDRVTEELLRQGKSLEDAREGGTSGCVEAGAFGKEAYILTGYLNLPKILELALHDGSDPRTGKRIGPRTGDPRRFESYDDLFRAWNGQLRHFVEIKVRGNRIIERLYMENMPAPFLSLLTDDCIARGLDYNEGGARYNTSYIQGVGIGTLADSLAALRTHVFESGTLSMEQFLAAMEREFEGMESLRQTLLHRTPKYGNDDDRADDRMREAFEAFFRAVDGRPNLRGGTYHINMLPTTCHVYFGSVTGATPDGRLSEVPLSEGISPSQGMDRNGPTAVMLSAGKMDHLRTGGTLLNMKFTPAILAGEENLEKFAALIRAYFRLGGHHVQFNVVDSATLRAARADPDAHRDLIVRVAGYSDYFCDLSASLQDEIITRTEHR